MIASWKPRHQQIYPGEALCALVIPVLHPQLLRDQDLLWFIDNEAAAASIIRASSGEEDVHLLAQASQVRLALLGARLWVEWIDSESNPADGLSRDGLSDEWTCQQQWSLSEFAFPPALDQSGLLEWLETQIIDSDCG